MGGVTTDLAERYGSARTGYRPVVVGAVVVVATAFLGWLAWAAWFHGTPDVESELTGYTVVDLHESTARVTVVLGDGVDATCRVRALAGDHTTVGELSFRPEDGRNEVSIRTEREATAVELIGCTAEGQPRPQ
jgi:hypothetical protein